MIDNIQGDILSSESNISNSDLFFDELLSSVEGYKSVRINIDEKPLMQDTRCIKVRDLNIEKNAVELRSDYVKSVLFDIFDPYLKLNTKYNKRIISCPRDKFIKRLNIKSDILDEFDNIRNSFVSAQRSIAAREFVDDNFVLFGGKVVDMLSSKNARENDNDFDIWITNYNVNDSTIFNEDISMRYPENNNTLVRNDRFNKLILDNFKIQIMETLNDDGITKFEVDISDILKNFDLRHCAIAVDKNNFYWIQGALKDVFSKRMVINKITPSKTIGMRIVKYANRGFKMAIPDLMISSIMQLSSMQLDNSNQARKIFTDRIYHLDTLHEIATHLYESI